MQYLELYDELRDGFPVSVKRKKIWNIQLEILGEIDRICRENDLRYYACNGTLLGAIRHQGFIPWDDDMDIMIPRPDYITFVEIAKKELQYPIYFQDKFSRKDYFRMNARIRNADTTAVSGLDMEMAPINGIYVDIFPIDGVPENRLTFTIQQKKLRLFESMGKQQTYHPHNKGAFQVIKRAFDNVYFKMYSVEHFLQKIEKTYQIAPYALSDKVYIYTHYKPLVMDKRWLEQYRIVKYETTQIRIPEGADEILKKNYGDYMKLPPESERGRHHRNFIDPDKPFTEYYKKYSKEYFKQQMNNY